MIFVDEKGNVSIWRDSDKPSLQNRVLSISQKLHHPFGRVGILRLPRIPFLSIHYRELQGRNSKKNETNIISSVTLI